MIDSDAGSSNPKLGRLTNLMELCDGSPVGLTDRTKEQQQATRIQGITLTLAPKVPSVPTQFQRYPPVL